MRALLALAEVEARAASQEMTAARGAADAAAAAAMGRVEREVVAMLAGEHLLGAPDLGSNFRGYRVGDGSIYEKLPKREAKLAIANTGLFVIVTRFADTTFVQGAPITFCQARILDAYCSAMRAALARHVGEAKERSVRFEAIEARARRLCDALA